VRVCEQLRHLCNHLLPPLLSHWRHSSAVSIRESSPLNAQKSRTEAAYLPRASAHDIAQRGCAMFVSARLHTQASVSGARLCRKAL